MKPTAGSGRLAADPLPDGVSVIRSRPVRMETQ
jgi:hypothetical protein